MLSKRTASGNIPPFQKHGNVCETVRGWWKCKETCRIRRRQEKGRINCQAGGSSLCISERVHVCVLQGWVKDKVRGSKRRAARAAERLSESRSTLNQLTEEEMERIGETSCF